MIDPQAPAVSSSERVRIAEIADFLIPAWRHMPSASAAGVGGELLDAVISVRPDLWRDVRQAVSSYGETPSREVARDLRANNPVGFDALWELVAGAYLLNSSVREMLGYRGQESSKSLMEPDEFVELVTPVVSRGNIFRAI